MARKTVSNIIRESCWSDNKKDDEIVILKNASAARSWLGLLYVITTILFIICFSDAVAKIKNDAPDLPKSIGIWTRPDSPRMVDASNIFDYMDGAGELYLAYRFKRLEVYKYAAGRESIEVEIYFMETPDDAFGLLSQDWGGKRMDMSASRSEATKSSREPIVRALYGAGLLRLWSGSIYARIMASRETPESKKTVLSLGRTIAGNDRPFDEPDLLNILAAEIPDGWKLQRNQIRFFRSHLVLNIFYYLGLENILNLDLSAEAVTATYKNSSGDKFKQARILFVKYATPEKASRAIDLFRNSYIFKRDTVHVEPGTIEKPAFFKAKDGWLGYKLKHDSLALVFQCPDEKSARAMINGIRFDP
jgi:hypothetical protein